MVLESRLEYLPDYIQYSQEIIISRAKSEQIDQIHSIIKLLKLGSNVAISLVEKVRGFVTF